MYFFLRKKQVQYNESIAQQQSRYNMELSSLREQLHEAETHRDLLEREVIFLIANILNS